ncbi:MAG: hypothetical protein J6X89_06925 [Bacteroidales bacterium]|nr:hypothetical protein [Bacteroidales bacterium]
MRKVTLLILAAALFVGISCVPNLDEINSRLDALEKAVAELNSLNTTVNGFSTAIKALESNVAVTSVRKNADGYTINFSDGTSATISNGKDGNAGPKGDKGDKGDTPQVGFKNVDGVLVWTVNGEVIKDPDGNPVPASASVPEFKFEDGTWYCRANGGDWVECGSADGEGAQITETNDAVVITVGDTSIVIPKDVIAPDITGITRLTQKLFIPKGQSIDIKEWFAVEPADAMKAAVDYEVSNSVLNVTEDGIVGATGVGTCYVYVTSKNDPEIGTTFTIRSGPVPTASEPACAHNPKEKHYLFENSLESWVSLTGTGGAANFAPMSNAIAGLVGTGSAGHNLYIRTQPVNGNVTKENGHLHFKYFISDIAMVRPGEGQVELTSSNNPDAQELGWSTAFLSNCKTGWNEVVLDFKDGDFAADFNPAAINWFRFFNATNVKADDDTGAVPYETAMVKDIYVFADPVPTITAVKTIASKLFVPVGEGVDLKEYFYLEPVGAAKTDVEYTYSAEAPFEVDENGVIDHLKGNSTYGVTVKAKGGDASATIYVRAANAPDIADVPAAAINPSKKFYLFNEGLSAWDALTGTGGAACFCPIANSIGTLVNTGSAGHNIYIRTNPVKAEVTMSNGHLHFMYYISDIAMLKPGEGQVELTSSNNPDSKELGFPTDFLSKCKNGWNEIDLKLSDGANTSTDGPIDLNAVNWFRFFNATNVKADDDTGAVPYAAAAIKDLYIYAE